MINEQDKVSSTLTALPQIAVKQEELQEETRVPQFAVSQRAVPHETLPQVAVLSQGALPHEVVPPGALPLGFVLPGAVPQGAENLKSIHDQNRLFIQKDGHPALVPMNKNYMANSDPAAKINSHHVIQNIFDKDENLPSSQSRPIKQEPYEPQMQTVPPQKRRLETLEEEASINAKQTTATVCTISSKKTKLLRRQESLSSPFFPGPKIIANTNPPLASYRKKFDAIHVYLKQKYPLLAEKDRIRVLHDLFSDAIHAKAIEIIEEGEGWSAGYKMSQWGTDENRIAGAATKNSATIGPGVGHLLSQGFLNL